MPSIIDNEVHGLLVDPGDVRQLGEAIATLYSDEEKCRSFGEVGYKKASKEYSRDSVYETLIATYKELTGI